MGNKAERKFNFDSLWWLFVLIGFSLLAKPYVAKNHLVFDEPESAIKSSDPVPPGDASRVPASRKPAVKRPKTLPKQKSVQSPTQADFMPSAEAIDVSYSQELEDIDNDAFREHEFLTKKVGLSEIQIQAMSLKRKIFLDDLKKISEIEYKQVAIRKHLRWMNQFLGEENYQEYLRITNSDET